MAKQSGGNTAQRVEALVRPVVEGMGLRLWDVVFEKEGPDWYLRVLISMRQTPSTRAIISRWAAPALAAS